MDNIASLELQTFADEPVAQFRINVFKPTKWQRIKSKITRRPLYKDFVIYKARTCNMARSAAIGNQIEDIVGDVENLYDLTKITLPLVHKHREKCIRLIACCIHNKHTEPPSWISKFLDANINGDMLFDILVICINNSGLQSFLSATMLIKGTSANFATDTDALPATEQV